MDFCPSRLAVGFSHGHLRAGRADGVCCRAVHSHECHAVVGRPHSMNTGDHTHMLGSVTQFLDAADMRQFFELRDTRQLDRTKARSTVAFDLTFAIVTLLSVVGLWLDIWSHATYGADQSIFSEYHLLFYSATVLAGLLLEYIALTNLRAGARWRDTLPIGYGLSFIGIVFFGIDGVIDLTTHA